MARRWNGWNTSATNSTLADQEQRDARRNSRIGVDGGGTLGTLFTRAGHQVGFSYSRSEKKLQKLARSKVVSAFSTAPSEELFGVFDARRRKIRPSMVYCGDDERAKDVAARLIRHVGFDPVDAGPLCMARHVEPFTMLIGQLAYQGDRGPQLAYRFEWSER
ncbi:MAG: hypothetical protein ACRDL7_05090 [Gaiellaceae bacterium]